MTRILNLKLTPLPGGSADDIILPAEVRTSDGALLGRVVMSTQRSVAIELPDELDKPFGVPSPGTTPHPVQAPEHVSVTARMPFGGNLSRRVRIEGPRTDGEFALSTGPHDWLAWAATRLDLTKTVALSFDETPAYKVWGRLWTLQGGMWRPKEFESQAMESSHYARQFELSLQAPTLLQLGGPQFPLRFVSLPTGRVRILLASNPSTNTNAESLKIVLSTVRAANAEMLLSLMAADALISAEVLARELAKGFEWTSDALGRAPMLGYALGYAALKLNALDLCSLEQARFLVQQAPDFPDASILLASRQLVEGTEDVAGVLKLYEVGLGPALPVLAEAMRCAHEGLTLLTLDTEAKVDRQLLATLSVRAGRYMSAQAWAGPFLSFYGSEPLAPSAQYCYGDADAQAASQVLIEAEPRQSITPAALTRPIEDDALIVWQPALQNLQGNILSGHGRDHTIHIFLRFSAEQSAVKQWIQQLAAHITSAQQQREEAKQYRQYGIPGRLFMSFFLSANGYKYLGLNPARHRGFDDTAFLHGMKASQHRLNDPPPEAWEEGYQHDIHAMVLLADDDVSFLEREAHQLLEDVSAYAETSTVEYGTVMRNALGASVEHFGYTVNHSQPLFFQADIDRGRQQGHETSLWDPSAGPDLVLVPDPYGKEQDGNGWVVNHYCGSYLVFRKLEQDVYHFKEHEQELTKALGLTEKDATRAGALIMGRFKDGTPVVLQPIAGQPTNNFTYDEDPHGGKCPLHAHIRKVNPRKAGLPLPRIVRRGITYGHRKIEPKENPSLWELPRDGVGLLFMCYQSNIEKQYEFLQSVWANHPLFPGEQEPGIDPVIGQPAHRGAGQQKWPAQWNEPREKQQPFDFYGFVTFKGGEYFFAPSVYFLRNITNIALSHGRPDSTPQPYASVSQQDPEPGTMHHPDVVGVPIPHVVGKQLIEARRIIETTLLRVGSVVIRRSQGPLLPGQQRPLRVGEITTEPSSRPPGEVLRQSPEAGESGSPGSAVNLVVAG